jgi:hypothetical protein
LKAPAPDGCDNRVPQSPTTAAGGRYCFHSTPPTTTTTEPPHRTPLTHTHSHTHALTHTHRSFTFFARRQSGLGDRSRFTHPEASVSLARERAPPQPKSNHRESVGILIAQDTRAPKTPRNLPNQSKMRRARCVQDTELLVPGILATVLHAPRSRASVAQYRAHPTTPGAEKPLFRKTPAPSPTERPAPNTTTSALQGRPLSDGLSSGVGSVLPDDGKRWFKCKNQPGAPDGPHSTAPMSGAGLRVVSLGPIRCDSRGGVCLHPSPHLG